MSIKNSIRFVEYSSVFVLGAFLLMVLSLVGSEDATVHINFWLLGASGVLFLIYLFKDKIIQFRVGRSKYRNLFWQVIEKIHLTENVVMEDTVQPGNQVTRLTGETSEGIDNFIKENGLSTRVGKRRTQEFLIWTVIILFLLVIISVRQFFTMDGSNTTLLLILGIMCIAFGYIFGNFRFGNVKEISIEFTQKALVIKDKSISWNSVIDWQYNRRDVTNNASITIFYFNTFLDVESINIELFQLNIRKIDLVLLLSHFKEKYGRNIY
ncbi:MAG TPA: hypothetical protein VL053_00975 [Arachidicoccus sp.]|nr:hypothetical protein [Arachidicoccus sp.]